MGTLATPRRPILGPWLGLCLAAALLSPARGGDATYRLAFSQARRRVVHVDAELHPSGREILMSPVGAQHRSGRWSRYVEGLVARDARGRPVRLRDEGNGRWRILGRVPDELHLAWRVRLDHDLEPWPMGWDSATYQQRDCTYLATDTLFLAPLDLDRARVSFELPRGWKVSSAWREVVGEPWEFEVAGFEALTHSSLLVGEHLEVRLELGDAEWVVAVGQGLADELGLIAEALDGLVLEATMLFGDLPAERFLLVANRAEYTGGAAHTNALSMVFGERPARDRALWSYVLAHELIHLWNGVAIRRVNHRSEWFAEGVTDYLAVLIHARAGLAADEQVLERLATSYRMYRGSMGERSLTDAGRDKLAHFDLIYGGGFWMGLLLDLELRAATRGRRSIEDLMRSLFEEYRDGSGGYDVGDLQRLANRTAGRSLTRFFQRHVQGEMAIPVEAYLARLGLEAQVRRRRGRGEQVTVRRREQVSEGQVALRRRILGLR